MKSRSCLLIFLTLYGCGKTSEPRSDAIPPAPSGSIDKAVSDLGTASKNQVFRAQIFSWEMGPQVTKSDATRNSFKIRIFDSKGAKPDSVEVVELYPYMKVHGHGVPKSYAPKWEASENLVHVTGLGFVMAGPWEINMKARVNGVEDSVEVAAEVP